MDFLQHINGGSAVLLVAGLCVLCLVLPIVFSGLHIITAIVGGFTHLLSVIAHIISGGPTTWCGCLVAIAGCGFIALMAWLIASGLANCATYSTNFCALFGR